MAALASASALFRGAALSVSAPAGSSRRARTGVRAEAEASTSTSAAAPINPSIRKESDKVVDTVQVAELSKPLVAYCRCWRSETFPLCNGAHVKHNKETGDNVGPLLLKK
ncbi:hypothetical protein M758_12G030200 [Ceratodon purpureus]|uniref:Iron-binding zinc finger CDGSH type domain-containing protein n=1 Tax=Ceratodon purpureus TaxID=3225 RepID=A0A8T0G440_CERPU|nr:hypothetical protein KC19_12G030400 [Ceratodon purpureus]KAG0597911.1 hypothetical protein M758_12G030200 [Ceratodon purpureus]